MGAVRQLADRYLVELCALDPGLATTLGQPGFEDLLPDVSPTGMAARGDLARRALRELETLVDEDDADTRCRALMVDRLGVSIDQVDAGEHLRYLRIIGSPVSSIRSIFDQMPTATDDDWSHIAKRMAALPAAYAGIEESLAAGLAVGALAAPRQALACADQLATWAGERGSAWTTDFLSAAPAAWQERIRPAADQATAAFAHLASWLRETYVPAAHGVPDGAGADRYQLGARQFLGTALDPVEAYEWAWDELMGIEAEMARVAGRIVPGGTIADALDHLDRDAPALGSPDDLRQFLQDLIDSTIDQLDGTHVDLPVPVRRVEAMLAPPGSAAAQYYTMPSADFRRPGRTWNPTDGRTRFPIWSEISTCYHEAVPGHHLQMATWVHEAPRLSMFQTYVYVSGNIEGWALYAERLMDELGYLTDPGARMGYLVAQQLRATRVVVDIGMHLSLTLPTGQPFHPGARFSAELGRAFLADHAGRDQGFLESEWVRYLGWPGQAISYKLGERVWLAGRAEATRRAAAEGRELDLRAWHNQALALGSTGLDDLGRMLPALGKS